ncbi:DivIVA domain-containing protein [Hymenobacter sp. BT186]|uniref:DivIVA domain-containing protein n=1 Tax=Hymenobacter telluris TaxID=2816474 RepID=A0A939EWS0_9BACT|nr:DivIVA domain-containing protein [Hymenobacter telluris]MBO0359279.1 DivIVA domain-containing protein [Hymenobacter telluris]MBW3375305.1 DivIVA domain-containing protein [Hymenobacter norwichensis]
MKITALDIRQKTFEKAFRGLNKEEVEAFLVTLSQQWERMGDENRELRVKLDHATQDVSKMREVETSLYRTLKTAEDTGNSITEQAQRDAELRIREAQLKAEQLLADARQKARAVVEDAYQQSEKTIAEMKKEVSGLGQECQRLEAHLEGLVRDLHHLASEALAKAEKARLQPKASTAAILSRAASVKVNRPDSEADSPQPAAMYATSSATSSAAAIGGSATSFASAPSAIAEPRNYNPKPGQQPDPGAPAQTPGPDIQPDRTPDENPGKADPSRIYEPGPAVVPNPVEPYTEPTVPDIQPVGPSHPEIVQPSPATHPGQPGMAAVASTEKSFFDEI